MLTDKEYYESDYASPDFSYIRGYLDALKRDPWRWEKIIEPAIKKNAGDGGWNLKMYEMGYMDGMSDVGKT